ncbi:hypothetical protein [Streptomyces sp. NPDC004726]
MRDAIARTLDRVLSFLTLPHRTGPGRHSAPYLAGMSARLPAPVAMYESPWSHPWAGPTKEEARVIFRQQAEERRQKRRVLCLATHGIYLPRSHAGVFA